MQSMTQVAVLARAFQDIATLTFNLNNSKTDNKQIFQLAASRNG